MTNEEKAREIAENNFRLYKPTYDDNAKISEDSCKECEASALEMSEWKDEQFAEVLESINKDILDTSVDWEIQCYAISVLDEIKQRLNIE